VRSKGDSPVRSKGDSPVRSKVDGVSEDRAVEQNERFGVGVWGVMEVEDIAVGSQAAEDG